ncbi:MAG: adenosine kinase [Alphaproteobacteria bacterium]|nr:adenosine kinase [Alphaproteobacteria bacterium]
MSDAKYGVVGLGNALVDVLSQIPEDFIKDQNKEHGIEKGTMALIDEMRAVKLYVEMPKGTETSGGSAANTMAGYASFGGKGAYIGKIANDELGKIFAEDIISLGLHYKTQPLILGAPTGRCMILVTPDAQRTMNTFLGASVELTHLDVDEELIADAQITYLEGYLFDRNTAKEAFVKAAEYAHKANRKIALTLSDPFCVDRHRDDFLNLVENHVDILFANEDEIKSLFMQGSFNDAINAVSNHVDVAVVTRSEKGAVIANNGSKIKVDAFDVETVIDTTGAGDQFAAGFLYGYTEEYSLERCGKLGALAASEVISHIGPRPAVSLSDLVANSLK